MSRNKTFRSLINMAKELKLPVEDILIAEEYLNHFEFGLCFEHLIDQIYELNLPIVEPFYQQVIHAGRLIDFGEDKFSFLRELISNSNDVGI